MMDFIISHSGLFMALIVAVLDLAFALNSKLESNGILHAIYVALKKPAVLDQK